MIIGIPKEIKTHEYRVSVTPQGAGQLLRDGHTVLVEPDAGAGSGFDDDAYLRAGARLVDKQSLFDAAEMVVKVKEPLEPEYGLLKPGLILFTYLHLAPNPRLTALLLEKRVTAFGYETLERGGEKPLLTPMSEIAGRMAPLVGSHYLQRPLGGTGVLPSGVPGVRPGHAVIIGAGVVGKGAAQVAAGIGMETVVLNRSVERLREIDQAFQGRIQTSILDEASLARELAAADLLIGAIYATGSRTPIVVTRGMLGLMKPGAVIVDVSIDQGGCIETSRPTTHDDPVFKEAGITHYCVANMPGAYPNSSTLALSSATLPYIRQLARLGAEDAVQQSSELASALNLKDGAVIHTELTGM